MKRAGRVLVFKRAARLLTFGGSEVSVCDMHTGPGRHWVTLYIWSHSRTLGSDPPGLWVWREDLYQEWVGCREEPCRTPGSTSDIPQWCSLNSATEVACPVEHGSTEVHVMREEAHLRDQRATIRLPPIPRSDPRARYCVDRGFLNQLWPEAQENSFVTNLKPLQERESCWTPGKVVFKNSEVYCWQASGRRGREPAGQHINLAGN